MITIPNAYIPIQNDSDRISNNERDFIINQACSSLKSDDNNIASNSKLQKQHQQEQYNEGCYRIDGRSLNQIRAIQLHLTRGDNIATCTIRWGISTRITCTVLGELVIPTIERPNEGIIIITVDIASSSNTSYRHTTPLSNNNFNANNNQSTFLPNADKHQKLLSNHILRCLERLIIQGGVLDPEALCVTVSKHVWRLSISITVMDAGGNLLDASVMACMAALRHYRKPIVQIINNDTNDDDEQQQRTSDTTTTSSSIPIILSPNIKEPTPLPLHHTPLSITFGLISSSDATIKNKNITSSIPQIVSLMDPNSREELCCKGYYTIGLNIYNEICLFEYSGGNGIEIPPNRFRHLYNVATLQIPTLFASFEKSLDDANEQAMNDRLRLLKISTTTNNNLLPPVTSSSTLPPSLDTSSGDGIPFYQSRDNDELMNTDNNNEDSTAIQNVIEEEYKRQALDYNLGHIATKIREDTKGKNKGSTTHTSKNNNKNSSLLLAALLQSVSSGTSQPQQQQTINPTDTKDDMNVDNNDTDQSMSQEKEQSMKKEAPDQPNQQQQQSQQKSTSKISHHDSEEEEEEEITVQIVSEFGGIKQQEQQQQEEKSNNNMKPSSVDNDNDDNDDDVDDLAAAIKNKKKKKKSKK